jgi:hypothetical protein
MRNVTGTVESIVSSARRLVGMNTSADTRREAFSQEFGKYPPYKEASKADRDQFVLDVVRPVLTERAQVVQNGAAGAGGDEFGRAYQVAVDMGLAGKGQTYRDYLDQQG